MAVIDNNKSGQGHSPRTAYDRNNFFSNMTSKQVSISPSGRQFKLAYSGQTSPIKPIVAVRGQAIKPPNPNLFSKSSNERIKRYDSDGASKKSSFRFSQDR